MSLRELKNKLSDNWRNVDLNNDGRAREEEVHAAFDKDGDGNLDKLESAAIARQLSAQMEYNNALLEHLQSLENSQLEAQRDMKKKEHALKLAVSVSNAARAEATETRRKLAISQEVAETMTKQCREARVEADAKQRQLELQRKNVEESKALYDNVVKEKAVIESRYLGAVNELDNVREEFKREKMLSDDQRGHLQNNIENLSAELNELRIRHSSVADENSQLMKNNMMLMHEVQQANQRLATEAAEKESEEKQIRELTAHNWKLREQLKDIQGKLKEEENERRRNQAEIQSITESYKRQEEELKNRENRLVELSREYKDATEENKQLKNELEQVGTDLLSQAKQREAEQARWAEKLRNAQEKLAEVTANARREAQEFVHSSHQRAAEQMEQRKESEGQYIILQAEHAELHDLLKDMQKEAKAKALEREMDRNNHEKKVRELNDRMAAMDADFQTRFSDKLGEIEKSREENRLLRQEMQNRGGRYVQMLTQVQSVIKQMNQEGQSTKEEIADIHSEFETLKQYVQTLARKHSAPLDMWYKEVESSFDGLVEQNQDLRRELEDTRDDLRKAELAKEEERTKNLMLEDEVSRMQHEVHDASTQLKDQAKTAQGKINASTQERDAVYEEKRELDKKLKRLQENLDNANSVNRSLQVDTHRLQTSLAELQAQQSIKNQQTEEVINKLKNDLKKFSTEKDVIQKNREDALKQVKERDRQVVALNNSVVRLNSEIERKNQELVAIETKANRKIVLLTENIQQYHNQLENTKHLLTVVQERTQHLQEDNHMLRGELDDIHVANATKKPHAA